MKITHLAANQLTAKHHARWREIQKENDELASGLFCPELVQAVSLERGNIEVALLEDDQNILGFFPFHRSPGDVADAVAGPLSGLEGAVMPASLAVEPKRLLRECDCVAWNFRHLLASQTAFQPYHVVRDECPFMDVSAGFEAFRQERRKVKSDELRETLRKQRKIQRELGSLRFEAYETHTRVLDTLLRWKSEQLARMQLPNALLAPWVRPLMERLLQLRTKSFAGMLSAVYVGDSLAAATMGVRSRDVLHGWVMGFERRFFKYSPGSVLLVQLAQAAESLGIRRIDMGKGQESFKNSFRSGGVALAEGAIDQRPMAGVLKQNWLRAREWVKTTPLAEPARRWMNHVRRGGEDHP